MEEIEKVDTSTPQNDGTDLVDTSKEEKVDNGFDKLDDADFEETKDVETSEKEPEKQEKKVEKTYTQAEFEKVLEKRLARLTAQHKKELEALETRYKTGDYSPEIKSLQEELKSANQKNVEMQNQLVRYEIDTAFTKAQVKDEFKEFVEYKVLRMVTEEKNFEKCLNEFKQQKENSQYFAETTGGKSIVPPRPTNSNADAEVLAGERKLQKAMGIK